MTDKNGTELSNEQVREVVKKQGRRDIGSFVNPPVEPGENSRYLRNALVSWNLPPIDISDPKQVEQRIGEYFQHCIDCDRRPQVVGMCNWLGINRNTLNEWLNGVTRKETHGDIIKKAYSVLEESWADLMMLNKINPAAGCFIGKNWYQYADTQQIIVTPNNPYQAASEDDLKEKYLTDMPSDDE